MPQDRYGASNISDLIAISSYVLAIVALAYFALEFIFTGLKDRISKAISAALHR